MKAPSKGAAPRTDGERNRRNSPKYREWFGEPEDYSVDRGSDNRNAGRMAQSRRTSRDDDDELQQPVAGQPRQSKRH